MDILSLLRVLALAQVTRPITSTGKKKGSPQVCMSQSSLHATMRFMHCAPAFHAFDHSRLIIRSGQTLAHRSGIGSCAEVVADRVDTRA